jgi:hypothetical protein
MHDLILDVTTEAAHPSGSGSAAVSAGGGWAAFQPLYQRIVKEQPDLLD